jgi:dipeptidyl aminopeptidase/acylaminoacyl peptidase
MSVSANGGDPAVIVPAKPGIFQLKPVALPDGKSFLYVRGTPGTTAQAELVVQSFGKQDSTVVLTGLNQAIYAPTGHLIYAVLTDLYAVRFDVASRKKIGSPARVGQFVDYNNSSGTTQFTLSNTGTLIYLGTQDARGLKTRLVAVDRNGKVTPLPVDLHDFSDPRVSPDGRMVAAHLQDGQNDVWVADVLRGTMSRLSFEPGEDETPAWSPDGRTVAWAATRGSVTRAIFRRAADGSGKEEMIWSHENHSHLREWLPDGKALLLEILDSKMGMDIWRLDLEPKPTATLFLQTPFNERNSRVSPDGKWIAYTSDESGRDEIYIQSFPAAGAKLQVSTGGGDQAAWAHNGKSLFFRAGGFMQEVTFESTPRLMVSKPRDLFPDAFESPQVGGHTGYDVFPDGRFLMIQVPEARAATSSRYNFVYVFNWLEEIQRLTSSGK